MNTHKTPILSKGLQFWAQLKQLFGTRHHAGSYNGSSSTQLAVTAYNFKPRTQAGFQWQVHNPTIPENGNNARKWRKNWDKFIVPEISNYKFSPTEGLSEISVSVSNKTSQIVDYVQVKVLYLEKDGSLYKAEYAELFDVSPNSTKQIPMYSSPSGEVLGVYITNVVADAFGLAYSKDSYE